MTGRAASESAVDIAIVGGGMVGVSLALLLSHLKAGWRIRVIESFPLHSNATLPPSFDGRSTALSHSSREIFELAIAACRSHRDPSSTRFRSGPFWQDAAHGCRTEPARAGLCGREPPAGRRIDGCAAAGAGCRVDGTGSGRGCQPVEWRYAVAGFLRWHGCRRDDQCRSAGGGRWCAIPNPSTVGD